MTENKINKVPGKTTVKVSPELLLEIINEQNRLLNLGQGKPSQGDLVNRAWRLYRSKDSVLQAAASEHRHHFPAGLSEEEHSYTDLLVRLMRHGSPAVVAAVTSLLDSQKKDLPPLETTKKRTA